MSNRKLLFLLTVVFLQTACSEYVKPTVMALPSTPSTAKTPRTEPPASNKTDKTVTQPPATVAKPSTPIVTRPQPKPKPATQPPAVLALLNEAEKHNKEGDLASANVDLERALRISPQNAEVTYQLALLRLKQSQFRLAEDLGKKAAYLAASDTELKKRCWILIAKARQLQGNAQGAQEALLKAESLE